MDRKTRASRLIIAGESREQLSHDELKLVAGDERERLDSARANLTRDVDQRSQLLDVRQRIERAPVHEQTEAGLDVGVGDELPRDPGVVRHRQASLQREDHDSILRANVVSNWHVVMPSAPGDGV